MPRPAIGARSALVRLAALPLIAAALLACGKQGAAPSAGGDAKPAAKPIDRSSPEIVLAQAYERMLAGDLAGMSPFLTERGSASVRRDLEAWRALLVDPAGGPRIAARIPASADPAERAAIAAAFSGSDPSALLRLYLRADPHPPLASAAPVPRPAEVLRVELSYPVPEGASRRVVLVRGTDGWRIDRFAL